jgi:glycosyltransferase involved in cell wall biosynthesis
MCDLWPEADVFTPVYDERGTESRFAHRNIYTSFLQRMRPTARNFRAFLPLYPAAIESFDLSGYDVVISSSSAWAHAVICDERAVHVSYCHNPFRYAWNERHRTLAERSNPISRAALRGLFRRWREWDWIAAQRVDRYVTNSRTTQARIKAYFGRDSRIIYPPVATERFRQQPVGEHYLVLSELVSHKQIDVAIEAFNYLKLSLVVTTGEEFGIAAVEAQAAGRPVIARAAGGLLENVIDGVTGRLWEGGPEELAEAVSAFDTGSVDPAACIENARRFDAAVFRESFPREVQAALREGPSERPETRPRVPRRPVASRRPAWRAGRFGPT